MSYLDPRPDWSPRPTPCEVVTQELADVFAILELLSLRLARLEEQAGNAAAIEHPEPPA